MHTFGIQKATQNQPNGVRHYVSTVSHYMDSADFAAAYLDALHLIAHNIGPETQEH